MYTKEIAQSVIVGHDTFTLVMPPSNEGDLGYCYRFVISPRPDQYESWFDHDSSIRILPLTGALLLDVDGEVRRIEKEQFVDIEPKAFYRFRGLEREPVRGYIFSASSEVEKSWQQVAAELKQRAVTGHGGQVRYR